MEFAGSFEEARHGGMRQISIGSQFEGSLALSGWWWEAQLLIFDGVRCSQRLWLSAGSRKGCTLVPAEGLCSEPQPLSVLKPLAWAQLYLS